MEKKIYEKPVMQVERFVPNDYCAICEGEGYTEWTAKCRDNGSCLIFYGGGEAGPDDWTVDANRGGCGGTHTFRLAEGQIPTANCWLLTSVTITSHWSSHGTTYEVSPSSAAQYFTGTISYDSTTHGHGITLTPEGVTHFMGTGELVRGYYNNHILGGGYWLVTDKPSSIKPHS